MRCPECNRKMKRFIYGFNQRLVDYCRRCRKIFEIKVEVIEPLKCVKCGNTILWEKAIYMANGKVRHRRCPKKRRKYVNKN
jgi:hypothetical protein